ncbi:MAG: NYN domain-containing protein [Gemmatimonadota bacterium]|nr:NYN domain-containing protein [Gemmatimonadota bacterium]
MTTSPLRHLRAVEPTVHAPNAALLIDFDNVTLGIRSDLAKELKSLLNSAIIKGKVAVSRAYADWRRYPQYIVPLSESSIDLIFAPAFGTNKKNATDIRLAIDAMELVFTRPEIGTFILLSGDSDFSMLVIKLKEYGKYVIGVGMRESASDLLIQNCDEYYSYSDLAGLTRETDMPSVQRDPWDLVREAVATMSRSGDVMRSDRLKQVMQQLDSTFDERNAGFSRFSKFVLEASRRGLLKSTKLDNGQYEIALGEPEAPKASAVAPATTPAAPAEPKDDRHRRGRGRGRGRGGRATSDSAAREAAPPAPAAPAPAAAPRAEGLTLARAFDLMRLALSELPSPTGHEALRLRMAALHGREDPALLPEQFARFLRQAHDAEVADVRKLGDDEFEIMARGLEAARSAASRARHRPAERPALGATGEAVAEPSSAATAEAPTVRGGIRFRRGSRAGGAISAIPMVGVVTLHEEEPPGAPAEKPARAKKKSAKVPAAEPPGKKGGGRSRKKVAE